eukprot:TRINITY_DN42153_c0_g1_i1.p1 TRINITY_DN42153_c0_g1~~TRINITY_DN42153_c0_g1_i1.p1  ORF type:complete len:427 (+),score=68.65 TRINITY_DN42153_c0_g1_i1:70-1350(+)
MPQRPMCVECRAPLQLPDGVASMLLGESFVDVAPSLRPVASMDISFLAVDLDPLSPFVANKPAHPHGAAPRQVAARVATEADIHSRIARHDELVALCSGEGKPRGPLCKTCSAFVQEQLQQALSALERDAEQYRELELYLQRLTGDTEELLAQQSHEDREHQRAELDLLRRELAAAEEEERALDAELFQEAQAVSHLRHEMEQLATENHAFEVERETREWQAEEHDAYVAALHEATRREMRFCKATPSALPLIFRLGSKVASSGRAAVGTINELRLSRLPEEPTGWDEINAAWGLLALCTQALSDALQVPLQRYTVLPGGSETQLQDIRTGARIDLFLHPQTNDYGSFEYTTCSNFDRAVQALACCVYDLAQGTSSVGTLRHAMQDGLVGGLRLALNENTEDRWTKACYFLVQNVRCVLELAQNKA